MNIREKITALSVLITTIPIIFVGTTMYTVAQRQMKGDIVAQLDSLASSHEDHVEQLISKHMERLQGVTSRTQLREGIREFTDVEEAETGEIEQILTDALWSIEDFLCISVVTPEGDLLRRVEKTPTSVARLGKVEEKVRLIGSSARTQNQMSLM
jgi:hypothetical protein